MQNETTPNEQKILAQDLQARNTRKQTQPQNGTDARRWPSIERPDPPFGTIPELYYKTFY